MAIQIKVNLSASPDPLPLPGTVTLAQTLRSNHLSEQINVAFSLSVAHDVWFELPSGIPSKTITFVDTVTNQDTVISHAIRMKRDAGTPTNIVGIDEIITDGDNLHHAHSGWKFLGDWT